MLGAGLAACDGLVWAELGAAMPEAVVDVGSQQGYVETKEEADALPSEEVCGEGAQSLIQPMKSLNQCKLGTLY